MEKLSSKEVKLQMLKDILNYDIHRYRQELIECKKTCNDCVPIARKIRIRIMKLYEIEQHGKILR